MQFQLDEKHKKIDLSKIKRPLIRFGAGALAGVQILAFSGMFPSKVYANEPTVIVSESELDNIVDLPDDIKYAVASGCGKSSDEDITIRDLQECRYLILHVKDPNIDLSFTKYLKECEFINLMIYVDDLSFLNTLESNCNYSLDLTARSDDVQISKGDLQFLRNPHIKDLTFRGIVIPSDIEEELSNLDVLSLNDYFNVDIDFTKLDSLKELDLTYSDPFDIAIFLNTEEYNFLVNHGCNIKFKDDNVKNTYLEINKKLDQIVSELDINENSSDREKLDAILLYVCEKLEYDETMAMYIENNMDHASYTQTFYEDGMLYGAIEKDSSICGNFAALVEALMDRVNLPEKSYIMESHNHAWNVVDIDGELYYTDATAVDNNKLTISHMEMIYDYDENGNMIGAHSGDVESQEVLTGVDLIMAGRFNDITWYLEEVDTENVSSIDDNSSSHKPVQVPKFLFSEDYDVDITYDENNHRNINVSRKNGDVVTENDEELDDMFVTHDGDVAVEEAGKDEVNKEEQKVNENIEEENKVTKLDSEKKYKLHIDKKVYIVSGAAVMGILSALGIAVGVKKHNDKKRRERLRRMQEQDMYYGFANFPYNDDFNSTFNSGRRR